MQRKLSRNKRKYSELQAYNQQQESTFSQMFIQAHDYPSFFNQNLVDDDRTIKIFYNQPYAHQTIFYFQLLRLIYQTEDVDYQKYLAKIYDLLDNPEFQFVEPEEDNYYYIGVGEARLRKMMQQFLEELGQGKIGVTQIITKYPVIDKIMVLYLRSILFVAGKCQAFDEYIQPTEIYEFLAEYFQIQIIYFTNCLRFNQSDLFVYFQAENEIYLAYITPKDTQQQIMSSKQFYRSDPEEAFNISSVKQMVSSIDIPIQQECLTLSKYNQTLNQTEFVEYDYSQSQQIKQPSKSIQENSQLKLSYLINDETSLLQSMNIIKSNKVLQKEIIGQKRLQTMQLGKIPLKNMDCFEIKEVPMEWQNATSPSATPKASRFASFSKGDAPFEKQNYNIYQKRTKRSSKVSEAVRQEFQVFSTAQSEGYCGFKGNKQKNNWQTLKKQTEKVLMNYSQVPLQKRQKTLKSIYQMRSIKSIISYNDGESDGLETPIKASCRHSREQTLIGLNPKKNQYTRYGYINNNISNEFTSSIILKEIKQPFKVKIETIKQLARKQRKSIQNMIYT